MDLAIVGGVHALLLSTMHTNDAVGATTRLLDMGVEPFLISSTVEAIMAQRLLRKICKHCKEPLDLEHVKLPSDFQIEKDETVFHGTGCRECRGSGYAGRTGIFELLIMNDELRELVVQRAAANVLRNVAVRAGLRLLREDGWDKVRAGLTTVEEVLRVSKA